MPKFVIIENFQWDLDMVIIKNSALKFAINYSRKIHQEKLITIITKIKFYKVIK